MDIKMIAAMDENRAIGKDNEIPWHIPDDFKHFQRETNGFPVILGRKTFESILNKNGQPLSNRKNIVITRSDFDCKYDNVTIVNGINESLQAVPDDSIEVYIVGGESIYEQFLNMADELILSHVDKEVENPDAYFPDFDNDNWKIWRQQTNPEFNIIWYKRNLNETIS